MSLFRSDNFFILPGKVGVSVLHGLAAFLSIKHFMFSLFSCISLSFKEHFPSPFPFILFRLPFPFSLSPPPPPPPCRPCERWGPSTKQRHEDGFLLLLLLCRYRHRRSRNWDANFRLKLRSFVLSFFPKMIFLPYFNLTLPINVYTRLCLIEW